MHRHESCLHSAQEKRKNVTRRDFAPIHKRVLKRWLPTGGWGGENKYEEVVTLSVVHVEEFHIFYMRMNNDAVEKRLTSFIPSFASLALLFLHGLIEMEKKSECSKSALRADKVRWKTDSFTIFFPSFIWEWGNGVRSNAHETNKSEGTFFENDIITLGKPSTMTREVRARIKAAIEVIKQSFMQTELLSVHSAPSQRGIMRIQTTAILFIYRERDYDSKLKRM